MTQPMNHVHDVPLPAIRGEVAIVGMACAFPGSRNLAKFWQNIVDGVDCIAEAPVERRDGERFHDPDLSDDDRVWCKRGGYLGSSFAFNPFRYGTMPRAIEGAEPDQFLVLRTVHEAIEDAGYLHRDLHATRASFVLGRGNYLGAGLANLLQRSVITEQTLEIIRRLHPELTLEQRRAIKKEMRTALPGFFSDTAPGLIPNITTGRVANRLDLTGATFTVDAACASSLIATEIVVRELLSGQCDLALAGGVHIFTNVPFLTVFTALGALSRSGVIRPFDEECDGMLPGEGVGIVVLKRLADANRDGDRIYAVIKGVGSSSDGRAMSVTAPRVEGEVLALQRAYDRSGVSPETVELIEAHGTGTPVGDPTEIEALRRVFGARIGGAATCAIGSVKSMIGHAMPAAGVASLIKTALALHHGVLPPTLHCRQPHELLRRNDSRFFVNTGVRPWIRGAGDHPRRAGVNAFGFGGVNAHVVLEECADAGANERPTLLRDWDSELCVLQGETRPALVTEAQRVRDYLKAANGVALCDLAFTLNGCLKVSGHRLAVVAASLTELAEKLDRAIDRLQKPDCTQIKDTAGIYYFGESPLREGKVAFLFPGLGSEYVDMMSRLCIHFPDLRACFDGLDRSIAEIDGVRPSAVIFPPPAWTQEEAEANARRLGKIEQANPALLTANGAMFTLLQRLRVQPDMMTGHSSGEWVALPASGMAEVDEFVGGMRSLNEAWSGLANDKTVPRMVMLAVGADRDAVRELCEEIERSICIVNDNCPHQVVIVVQLEDAEAIRRTLLSRGVFVETLPYEHGYHSPDFGYVTEALRKYFSSLRLSKSSTAVYSCATAERYPDSPEAIVDLLSRTFAQPVRFRDTVEAMYRDGARIFVEVGPRGNLSAFVDDILRGRPHMAVATNQHRRSDLLSLHHALGKLAALYVAMDLTPLYAPRGARCLRWDAVADRPVDDDAAPGTVQIPLHYQMLRVKERPPAEFPSIAATSPPAREIALAAPITVTTPTGVPMDSLPTTQPGAAGVLSDYFRVMEQFLQTQEEVMRAYMGQSGAAPAISEPATALQDAPLQARVFADVSADSASEVYEAPPQPLAPMSPPPVTAAPRSVTDVLLAVVSERTGYPVEMLNLDADMEADLGIDSIKRVEILGTLQQQAGGDGGATAVDMERVAKLKTLRQVLEVLEQTATETADVRPASPPAKAPAFAGEVVRMTPGQEVVVRRRIDPYEDLYLEDHRFGPRLSDTDPTLGALPVVPLTVSLEMMAEVASLLRPELRVVGAKDMQASRWIDIPRDDAKVAVDIHARAVGEHSVRVAIRTTLADGAMPTAASSVAEVTIQFAAGFPAAPGALEASLRNSRPCLHTAEELYSQRRMFHGPSFQGVASLDRIGEDGLSAHLKVLPTEGLLRSNSAPKFHFDPCLLDAAGQLVGYWPVEFLEEGFVLFPIRIGELSLYQENPPPGEQVECRLRIREVAARQLRADMDVLTSDGRLWMRIVGWQDWRFYWARNFYDFWRFPKLGYVSERLTLGADLCDEPIECRKMSPVEEMGSSIWENLWAHLICNRRERAKYWSLPEGRRRTEWIFGRTAAKDAVRAWIKSRHGRDLYPADVEIVQDESGKPFIRGDWIGELGEAPHISISHKNSYAVAAASALPVGIDLEQVIARDEAFESAAFDEGERTILGQVNGRCRGEWVARAWSAKEAAGKAVGVGLSRGPATVRIRRILDESGEIRFSCETATDSNGQSEHRAVWVRSFREGELVIGLAVGEEPAHAAT